MSNNTNNIQLFKLKLFTNIMKSLKERNSKLSQAIVKNKAAQLYLNSELQFMDKQKKTMMRLDHHYKEKFKMKYLKAMPKQTNRHVIGDYVDQSSEDLLKQIRNLLYTNNELDLEKIICLYLISAHRTESLRPQQIKLTRHYSPVERLLERSSGKKTDQLINMKLIQTFPLYTLEIGGFSGEAVLTPNQIRDGRLATRIVLNEKLRDILNSVLTALKQSNLDKFDEISDILNDPDSLEDILRCSDIGHFLNQLHNVPVITSCESFILTQPFKIKAVPLEIRTKDGSLERLVLGIRQNLLQVPLIRRPISDTQPDNHQVQADKTMITLYKSKLNTFKKSSEKNVHEIKYNTSSHRNEMRKFQMQLSKENKHGNHKNSNSVATETETIIDGNEQRIQPNFDIENFCTQNQKTPNFVKRNIVNSAKSKRIPYDIKDDDDESEIEMIKERNRKYSQCFKRSHMKMKYQPMQLITKLESADSMEKFKVRKYTDSNDSITHQHKNYMSNENCDSSSNRNLDVKARLKQTTCPACMEKWKVPLPPPKTSRVKKILPLLPLSMVNKQYFQTNTERRVSSLIDKEVYKMQSIDRNTTKKDAKKENNRKLCVQHNMSSECMNLSPVELAQIEQEIREKETEKKLKKFLTNN